jgi:hypothetical protein
MVTVVTTGTTGPPLTIYSSNSTSSPQANPFYAGSNGYFDFYIASFQRIDLRESCGPLYPNCGISTPFVFPVDAITLDPVDVFPAINTYYATLIGDEATTGIATGISDCGTSAPCMVVVPGNYPRTEAVPGYFAPGTSIPAAGVLPANVTVEDERYGDAFIVSNPSSPEAGHNPAFSWQSNISCSQVAGGCYKANYAGNFTVNALHGGYTQGASGAYSKSSVGALEAYTNKWTPESATGIQATCYDYSSSDCPTIFASHYYSGNHIGTGGEEGAEVLDFDLMQGTTAYQGTVASCSPSCGTSVTSITLTPTAGAGTQGEQRFLLDMSNAQVISGDGTIASIGSSWPNLVTCSSCTHWPTAGFYNTTTSQAISAPGTATIQLASVTGIVANSTVLVVEDLSGSSVTISNLEYVIPTAVGTIGSCSTTCITATFASPHASGSTVGWGGLAGYFLELTADTVPSGTTGGTAIRQAFPILYQASSTTLYAALGTFSQASTTQCCGTGYAGYVIYAGAEVTSVFSSNALGNTFSLAANVANFAVSDTVEEPLGFTASAFMGTWNFKSWWPNYPASGPRLGWLGVPSYGTYGITFSSNVSTNLYNNGGSIGTLYPPSFMINSNMPWGIGINLKGLGQSTTALVQEQDYGNCSTQHAIFETQHSGGGDTLSYNNCNATWLLSVNNSSGNWSFSSTGITPPGGAAIAATAITPAGSVGQVYSQTGTSTQGWITLAGSATGCAPFDFTCHHLIETWEEVPTTMTSSMSTTMGWQVAFLTGQTAYPTTVCAGTPSWCFAYLVSDATSGHGQTVYARDTPAIGGILNLSLQFMLADGQLTTDIANGEIFHSGLLNATTATAPTSTPNGCYIRLDTTQSDTTFMAACDAGSGTPSTVSTAITPTNGSIYRFKIYTLATRGEVYFQVGNTLLACMTASSTASSACQAAPHVLTSANVPASSTATPVAFSLAAESANAVKMQQLETEIMTTGATGLP